MKELFLNHRRNLQVLDLKDISYEIINAEILNIELEKFLVYIIIF